MSKSIIRQPRDCCDPKKVETFAKQNHIEIIQAKGDHKKLKYTGEKPLPKDMPNEMVYCDREMGTGIGCKIFKWFAGLGFLAAFLYKVFDTHPELIYAIFPNLG